MSIRQRVLSDVEKEKAERQRQDDLQALVHAARGRPLTADVLDLGFTADPDKDRLGFFDHFGPVSLSLVLLKNGLMQSLLLASKEQPPELPNMEDPADVARFAARELWKPVLKDVAITQFTRLYEHLAAQRAADAVEAGRWVRQVRPAVAECARIAADVQPEASGVLEAVSNGLSARAAVSLHAATVVIPRVSLIANLALATVEELDLLLSAGYRQIRRHQLRAASRDSSAPAPVRQAANKELSLLDTQHKPEEELGLLVRSTAMNAVKCLVAVGLEMLGGAVGTFVWPGYGTVALQLVGGAGVYIMI